MTEQSGPGRNEFAHRPGEVGREGEPEWNLQSRNTDDSGLENGAEAEFTTFQVT